MSQPDPYVREFGFESYQSSHPSTPVPGDKLDAEFDAVGAVVDEVLERIAILQRDDLELANKSVGYDQLKDEVSLSFEPPSVWATATAYVERDMVFQTTKFYRCLVSHTSGVFATDLADGKWLLIADFTHIVSDAEAAAAAAEAAQLASEAARDIAIANSVGASNSAAAALLSETNAAASESAAAASALAAAASQAAAAASAMTAAASASASQMAQIAAEAAQAAAEAAAASIVIGPGGVQAYSANLDGWSGENPGVLVPIINSAVQPALTVSAGTGLTGGGDLSANRTIALNGASIASLALADTAVQPSGIREKLTSDRTIHVRNNLGAVSISNASPAVVTKTAHGLVDGNPVVISAKRDHSIVTMTIASPAVVTLANHGYAAGQRIKFSTTGALPTGVAATFYYVLAAGLTSNTFQFSPTAGGAAINSSGTQSGTHLCEKVGALNTGLTEGAVYYVRNAAANTFQLAATPGGAAINTTTAMSGIWDISYGDDANDGSTLAKAVLTPQRGADLAYLYDYAGLYKVTVQLADSWYTSGVRVIGMPPGATKLQQVANSVKALTHGPLIFKGNETFPGNVVVITTNANALSAHGQANIYVGGFGLVTVTDGDCVCADNAAVTVGPMFYFSSAYMHKEATDGGYIALAGDEFVLGGATGNEHTPNQGLIKAWGMTTRLFGVPAFSAYFTGGALNGSAQWISRTIDGTATGARHLFWKNAALDRGATTVPGNSDHASTKTFGGIVYPS